MFRCLARNLILNYNMLELDMLRKTTILILYIFLSISLDAKEPLLAKYESTISSGVQIFAFGNHRFKCKAYGILTLEDLYKNSKSASMCKNSILSFYNKNPKSRNMISEILKYDQLYHVEIKSSECIIYASGEVSLSEILLREGLAILKPFFKDKEFNWPFMSAQRKAKMERKGLWSENIFNNCIEGLYK